MGKGTMELKRLDDHRWLIPRQGKMRVDGLIFADDKLMQQIRGDQAVDQVANVATLPGIVGHSIGMPDIHWGYGFAIGGVAAFDPAEGGVISPGGVGYDINCGVRLHRSNLKAREFRPHLARLMDELYASIPSGVGKGYRKFVLETSQVRDVLERGAAWVVDEGYGWTSDLDRIEDGGTLPGARPDRVGERAVARGKDQVGTVGSGNHFVEVGFVDEVYDERAAGVMGLSEGTVTTFVHSGSRGLGYQVCDDYLDRMMPATRRYGIELPDRQLVCAPVHSDEGQAYIGAMRAAANFAFANRQMMGHRIREAFAKVFGSPAEELGLDLVYDVAHNNAKEERHRVGGREQVLWVHRKGATRAFPPGHPDLSETYRELGQPVLIPGDMGRYSYVLVGTEAAFDETFGSTCHGAGRLMSRTAAVKAARGRRIDAELAADGVVARATGRDALAEEMPEAYKDVKDVVEVVHRFGISRKVARLKPIAVIKG
jgi:tRNA-splicing ligase RtcB (3'-phosphate/5'-hydroxy nucleic acid ligase)